MANDRRAALGQRKRSFLSQDFTTFRAKPCPRSTGKFREWVARPRANTSHSGVWSVRRVYRTLSPTRVLQILGYVGGFALVLGGLYGACTTLGRRGTSDEILNDLLWVFLGFFLVFLSSHEKAVAKKREMVDN